MGVLVKNRKASFDYQILEKFQAGIVLNGQEVKSIRLGRASLEGSHVTIRDGEVFLLGSNIPPYQPLNVEKDYDSQRERKLLLNRKEIDYLTGKMKQKGLTLVPIKMYTGGRLIKLEFGLGRGKKKYDKRETIKKREIDRNLERRMKGMK